MLSMELREASARVTRQFKAGSIVDTADIDLIETHAKSIRNTVVQFNIQRAKELGQVVKTK
jgi:hypothetical protein